MSKDPNDMDKTKAKEVELLFGSYEDRKTTAVQFLWPRPDSLERLAAQHQFYDSILAWAELPATSEWPKILKVSRRARLPSIWQRVHPSPLESSAAALLTALAFSSRKHRTYIVGQFLKAHGLTRNLPGRPRVAPGKTLAIVRGIQIQKLMQRFQEGFEMVIQARRRGGFSDDAAITTELKKKGYNNLEAQVLLVAKTLQDAACKYFVETSPDLKGRRGALKVAQNSIALYKKTLAVGVASRP